MPETKTHQHIARYGQQEVVLRLVLVRGAHFAWAGFGSGGEEIGILVQPFGDGLRTCLPTDEGSKYLVRCKLRGRQVLLLSELNPTPVTYDGQYRKFPASVSTCKQLVFRRLLERAEALREETPANTPVPFRGLSQTFGLRQGSQFDQNDLNALRMAGWRPTWSGWVHDAR